MSHDPEAAHVLTAKPPEPPVVDVLGVPIARIDLAGLLSRIVESIERPSPAPLLLAYANAHTCNLAARDPAFRRALHQMDIVYLDGNGPRLAAWLSGATLPRRMTGADWIHDLCQLCVERGFGLYFLGAQPGVAAAAAHVLQRAHPGLCVLGTHDGYFSPSAWPGIEQEIQSLAPAILVVGMASPHQETWMLEVAPRLGVRVIWGAGGMFDYASGRLHRAPPWMRAIGLEWLGRMLVEPRRLLPRYLLGIPFFLGRSLAWGAGRRLHRMLHPAE